MTYKEAGEYLPSVTFTTPLVGYGAALSKAIEALEIAENVVQCKECKHWKKDSPGCTDFVGRCDLASYMVGATGFCSYGERRADNG